MDVNPERIVTVADFSSATLQSLIAHLEVSTAFEHLVYREAELDALWSITGLYLRGAADSDQRRQVIILHDGAQQAHDLVADRRPRDAAAILRNFL